MSQPLVPPDAVEDVTQRWEDGTRQAAFYYLTGEKVGYRQWDEAGRLHMEYRLKNGALLEESFYIERREHGTARQYDWDGQLIGTYEMEHGTGADMNAERLSSPQKMWVRIRHLMREV